MFHDNEFPQIKKDLINRIERIENYIVDGTKIREEILDTLKKMNLRIYGDLDANPPFEGYEQRIKTLETAEGNRIKNRDNVLKMAIGSVTIAIGSILWWIFGVLKDAFTRGH
jgi:hypothetical protein